MQTKEFQQIALQAKKALFLEDVCRMDLRIDNAGNPYILEVNPLPACTRTPSKLLLFALLHSRLLLHGYRAQDHRIGLPALANLTNSSITLRALLGRLFFAVLMEVAKKYSIIKDNSCINQYDFKVCVLLP
jgi:hypothetical protein